MWRQKGKCITRDGFLYEEEKGLAHVIHAQDIFLECTCYISIPLGMTMGPNIGSGFLPLWDIRLVSLPLPMRASKIHTMYFMH
jgi:hypothetical protein